jgi:hypothetical protein
LIDCRRAKTGERNQNRARENRVRRPQGEKINRHNQNAVKQVFRPQNGLRQTNSAQFSRWNPCVNHIIRTGKSLIMPGDLTMPAHPREKAIIEMDVENISPFGNLDNLML